MQANWSLILNVSLLIGIIFAIWRLLRVKGTSFNSSVNYRPALGQVESFDEILAVRKINCTTAPENEIQKESTLKKTDGETSNQPGQIIMMFLLAKQKRQFAGYELLQTLLAAGLRLGEGNLFHRHQQINGQGTILCSLAAATSKGEFDLENIGTFSIPGLCLFMYTSGNSIIDTERFIIMHEIGKQLQENLDAYLLDDARQPLSSESLVRYQHNLNTAKLYEISASD